MDVLIVYERKSREFENAVLLKSVLDSHGISCEIRHSYDVDWIVSPKFIPKIILCPSLYSTKAVSQLICRFGRPSRIINFQYEQVLSEKWERLGHHDPSGEAQKAIHLCWGPATANRMHRIGISNENIALLGALQLDLLRPEFSLSKEALRSFIAKKYNIKHSCKWKLFLSSFTYADITPERLKINENVAKTKLADFPAIYGSSRDELLKWFESAIQVDTESIFIYRPHPDELNLEKVKQLEIKYSNFKIIGDGAAKLWIMASDFNYSWYSTTVVESHFLGKPYEILRPFPLANDFDSVLLKHGRYITKLDDFLNSYLSEAQGTEAIDKNYIHQYYLPFDSEPVFVKLTKLIQNELASTSVVEFNIPVGLRLKYFIINKLLMVINKLNKGKPAIAHRGEGGLVVQISKEIRNQGYLKSELDEMLNNIRAQLQI